MTDDHESTTVILKKYAPGFAWLPRALRERLTPAALWGTLGALAIAIAYLVGAQRDISQLKESVTESNKSVADLRQQMDLLHKIDTQIQVMSEKVDDIASEVNHQREWREHIETEAESRPYKRQRH